jgi:uncharacterized BrkB/YihY/UPF0761 family membrane protein
LFFPRKKLQGLRLLATFVNKNEELDMKVLSKAWFRYLIVFLVALVLVAGWFRFGPNTDPEGSNLVVNSVLAAILTVVYVGMEKVIQSMRK